MGNMIPEPVKLEGYQFIRSMGGGRTGSVFLACQENTGQLVVVKLLREMGRRLRGEPDSQGRSERFEREIRLCAQLHHPNIVKVLDRGRTEEGRSYAVFEFVPGRTLRERLMCEGPFSPAGAARLMGQLLDALACIHGRGIVHRDLNPNNIMVTRTGIRDHVKLLDFGSSIFLPEVLRRDDPIPAIADKPVGTPAYGAPEQLRGELSTPASDLYAWGLIFIECITGRPAVQGATLAEIFHKQLSPREIPMPRAVAGLPLADLLQQVIRKDPGERAQRAASVCTDLQELVPGNTGGGFGNVRPGAELLFAGI